MDNCLSNKLSLYFDQILEDSSSSPKTTDSKNEENKSKRTTESKSIYNDVMETESEGSSNAKRRKRKRKKHVVDDAAETKRTKSNATLDSDEKPDVTSVKKSKSRKKKENRNKVKKDEEIHDARKADRKETAPAGNVTEDGFKIVSTIPEDDSDVSDAFECDSDDCEGQPTINRIQEIKEKQARTASGEPRKTDDGFKIVTEIPSDDSDVSDAFDEDDPYNTQQDLLTQGQQAHVQRAIKKPILQMMDDFGIDGNTLFEKPNQTVSEASKPSKKRKSDYGNTETLTQAAKKKQQKEVVILDYAKKRGTGKKVIPVNEENISQPEELPSQEVLDEKIRKQYRYDVFKFGMSGFHKEKKQDTRVALAIKLGAKPPKNKAMSYKDLLVKKKEEKKKELEEKEVKRTMGQQVSKPSKNKPSGGKKSKSFTPQIGQYKHGMQVLSKKDLSKINAS